MTIHAKNGLLEFIIEQHTLKRPKVLRINQESQTPTKIPRHYSLFKGCEQKKEAQHSLSFLALVCSQLQRQFNRISNLADFKGCEI